MKPCTNTFWLGLEDQGSETLFLVSDRAQKLTATIPDCDVQQPSLFVLIGNTTKSAALREIFGIRRSRRSPFQRGHGLHLHVDPSSIFRRRPLLVAEGDIRSSYAPKHARGKCHRVNKRIIERPRHESEIAQISTSVYSQLLYPFADVFMFFSDDIGGLKQVAHSFPTLYPEGHSDLGIVPALGETVNPADRVDEFRSIVEKIRHFYEVVRDDQDHYVLSLPIWEAGCPELPKSDAFPPVPPPKPKPSVSISSMGNVDAIIASKHGQIVVDKPWVTGEELGNGLGLFLGTFRSKMSISAAYNDSWHNKSEVENFVYRCKDLVLAGLGLAETLSR
ncbi:hypothetical protein F5883DRAFT_718658 [Diaporthe sp. PMI_573]|nr:hypothetical protein F5883DRAFT_718658 [Diaporthaceae sp. PMI_573]